jgi:hypothetical protein
MAGGAERGRPRGPGLAAAFRAAAYDFYYQSIRLVPANLLWGLAFLAWLIVSVSTGPLVTLVGAPLMLGMPSGCCPNWWVILRDRLARIFLWRESDMEPPIPLTVIETLER